VLTQHRSGRVPDFIKEEIGSRVFIEPLDVADTAAFLKLGERYDISGIVHLGGSYSRGPSGPFENIRTNMAGLANALQAAYEWKVKRILIPSTLAVYGGVMDLPWREDQPISCTAAFPIEALKKAGEVFCSYVANNLKIECIVIRIAGIYGPLYNTTRGSLAGRLVPAAVKRTRPDLQNVLGSIYADDGFDWCYAKDCGRAIALLQTAQQLHHSIYNVASGRPTKNRDLVNAITKIISDFDVDLPPGVDPNGLAMVPYQDITWLHEDTGYEPRFSVEAGIADYIAWLRAGNAE
jgi:UDP-glucose 4-epimerase